MSISTVDTTKPVLDGTNGLLISCMYGELCCDVSIVNTSDVNLNNYDAQHALNTVACVRRIGIVPRKCFASVYSSHPGKVLLMEPQEDNEELNLLLPDNRSKCIVFQNNIKNTSGGNNLWTHEQLLEEKAVFYDFTVMFDPDHMPFVYVSGTPFFIRLFSQQTTALQERISDYYLKHIDIIRALSHVVDTAVFEHIEQKLQYTECVLLHPDLKKVLQFVQHQQCFSSNLYFPSITKTPELSSFLQIERPKRITVEVTLNGIRLSESPIEPAELCSRYRSTVEYDIRSFEDLSKRQLIERLKEEKEKLKEIEFVLENVMEIKRHRQNQNQKGILQTLKSALSLSGQYDDFPSLKRYIDAYSIYEQTRHEVDQVTKTLNTDEGFYAKTTQKIEELRKELKRVKDIKHTIVDNTLTEKIDVRELHGYKTHIQSFIDETRTNVDVLMRNDTEVTDLKRTSQEHRRVQQIRDMVKHDFVSDITIRIEKALSETVTVGTNYVETLYLRRIKQLDDDIPKPSPEDMDAVSVRHALFGALIECVCNLHQLVLVIVFGETIKAIETMNYVTVDITKLSRDLESCPERYVAIFEEYDKTLTESAMNIYLTDIIRIEPEGSADEKLALRSDITKIYSKTLKTLLVDEMYSRYFEETDMERHARMNLVKGLLIRQELHEKIAALKIKAEV